MLPVVLIVRITNIFAQVKSLKQRAEELKNRISSGYLDAGLELNKEYKKLKGVIEDYRNESLKSQMRDIKNEDGLTDWQNNRKFAGINNGIHKLNTLIQQALNKKTDNKQERK